MPRRLKIAAIQMNAEPAPKVERLERAEAMVAEAASAGAQLVVLPEVFNTGYEYHENNYALPEPIDGQTVTWMKKQAADLGIHLAGSLLLLDGKDVFNSQILVAPDGRMWRYDKNYPYAFERAYFKDGSEITVADTDLGKFGMMICWDYAHPELWGRYAGKIDAMIVTSSPPTYHKFMFIMPDGKKVDSRALGPILNKAFYGDTPFGNDMNTQAAWLGVPLVNTTGTGKFRSYFPAPRAAMVIFTAMRPDLWKYIPRAAEAELMMDYYHQTKIVDADGHVVVKADDSPGFVLGEVELADPTPAAPTEEQPDLPYAATAYFATDVFGTAMTERFYREGVRRHWGQRMAPFQRSQRWLVVAGLAFVAVLAALLRFIGRATSGGSVDEDR